MVIVKEFRVVLPLSVEEFQRGQLYAVAECSKNETGGGEGAEFLKQEDFVSTDLLPGKTTKGVYTYKLYRLRSKAPWLMQKTLPEQAFEVHEESWNAFPYCKTVITNPGYMGDDFKIVVESTHLPDNGSSENPLNAPKSREIQMLDICDDSLYQRKDYDPKRDPKLFKSKKNGRGPLASDWMKTANPVMCAYKVVTVQFKMTGLGGMIEKTIVKQYPRVFGHLHREAWIMVDCWWSMSMADIRKMEEDTTKLLRSQIKDSQLRGTSCNDNDTTERPRA